MKTYKEFVNESSLGRIHSHMKDRNVGIISAHRGNKSPEENERNHQQLKKDVREHGFGYINVHGHYTEDKGLPTERKVKEKSIMVIGHKGDDGGKLKGFLKKHGEKYEQDTILHKSHDSKDAHLVGTSHKAEWIKHGEHMNVGEFHPNRAGEFHSKLRNKSKTFQFGEEVVIESLEDVKFTYDKHSSFFSRNSGEFDVVGDEPFLKD